MRGTERAEDTGGLGPDGQDHLIGPEAIAEANAMRPVGRAS
jgi:hypothetical protein